MDDYERQHMRTDGEVLYRHKTVAPKWTFGLSVGAPFLGTAATSPALLATGAPLLAGLAPVLGGAVLAAGLAGLLVTFAVARIVVSDTELILHVGPKGPRIAIEDIESVEIGDSGINNWGLGVAVHLDGTRIYKLMGDNRRAVRLTVRGKKAPIVLVMRDPDGLVAALREAKARSTARVRVALGENEPLEHGLSIPAEDPAMRQRARS